MKKEKFACEYCENTFMLPKIKTRKYHSKACRDEAKRIRKRNAYHAGDKFRRKCQACGNLIFKYRFSVACSQECRIKIDERNRREAQKCPCKQCGNDITRPKSHKYCSAKCRYEALLERKRKHPRNTNCKQCGEIITDSRKTVYCSTECRLKSIQDACDIKRDKSKKCKKCKTVLVNKRRTYCTTKCNILSNADQQIERAAEQVEINRIIRSEYDTIEKRVAKTQRDAAERRAALRG